MHIGLALLPCAMDTLLESWPSLFVRTTCDGRLDLNCCCEDEAEARDTKAAIDGDTVSVVSPANDEDDVVGGNGIAMHSQLSQ